MYEQKNVQETTPSFSNDFLESSRALSSYRTAENTEEELLTTWRGPGFTVPWHGSPYSN